MTKVIKDKDAVRARVEVLLRRGFLTEERDSSALVGEPLAVNYPKGGQHSWFVPLLDGEKLVGFAQILPSFVPLRVSSFRKYPHDSDSCPDAVNWIDAAHIKTKAAALARAGEQLSDPVLSFDQVPDRIVWRVAAAPASGGVSRILFVAGDVVYEGSGPRGVG